MELTSTAKNTTNEDLSLYGLFLLFINNWLILVISGLGFAVIALIWAVNQPNIYKAETLLMPVKNDQGGLSGIAGNLGGLASLAGVSIPEGKNDNTKLAMELLKSRQFISKFIEENNLLVPIVAAKNWDVATNKLVIDENKYDTKTSKWIRKTVAPRKTIPSLQEAYDVFISMLEVEVEPKTKFVRVSIEFYSPYLAAEWTAKLISMLNEHIRALDRTEANDSIAYLKELAEKSYVAGLKNIFSSLMEEQLKSQMLAEVRKDYVFKVVDPAIAPEVKSKPKRAIIIIIAGFFGGIIGMIIILFRSGRSAFLAKQL